MGRRCREGIGGGLGSYESGPAVGDVFSITSKLNLSREVDEPVAHEE